MSTTTILDRAEAEELYIRIKLDDMREALAKTARAMTDDQLQSQLSGWVESGWTNDSEKFLIQT